MENGEESTGGMTEVENKSLDVAEDVKTDEEELPDVVMNAKAPVNNEEKWKDEAGLRKKGWVGSGLCRKGLGGIAKCGK